jgi:hypothetical protein
LNGKIPLVANGSKDATLNEATAREWWKRWPRANIGLATGHRFFAFDVDLKDGGEESYDFLRHRHGSFPETIEQLRKDRRPDSGEMGNRFDRRQEAGVLPACDCGATGGFAERG